MNKKFTIDTIKDLKTTVKEMNQEISTFYTPNEFKPDFSFSLVTEQCEAPEIEPDLVSRMIAAFEGNETEFEAGQILFENLNLTPKQASDIGFWTYHNHYTFYKYISRRWNSLWENGQDSPNPSKYILNHWIQSNSSQQELIIYPISGLWWSFYITVDETRKDKYELTKLFFKNYTLRVVHMGQVRFARHKPAILGVLEFINENNIPLEEADRAIVPYINLLGGIRPLSYFDKEWFKNKLENRFGQQIKEGVKLFMRPNEQ